MTPFNVSAPLGGNEQTNSRAELSAVIRVLELDLRNVEIRTDSTYVVNGIQKLGLWRRRNFWTNRREIKNADLWRKLDVVQAMWRKTSWASQMP